MKVYLSQYDSLVVPDDSLYREWISSNFKTKVLQLVVPRNDVNTVLEEAHDSPSGGHFGINKTLQKIRKRFYWTFVKKMLKIGVDLVQLVLQRKVLQIKAIIR